MLKSPPNIQDKYFVASHFLSIERKYVVDLRAHKMEPSKFIAGSTDID